MTYDWTLMKGKKRPTKDIVSFFENKILEELTKSPKSFTKDFYGTQALVFENTPIAGIKDVMCPWGNYEKWLSPKFWTKVSEVFGLKYHLAITEVKKKKKKKSKRKNRSKKSKSNKSNRAFADYVELRVIKEILDHFELDFPYEKELRYQENKILKHTNWEEKYETQNRNSPDLVSGVIKIIEKNKNYGEVENIIWTGRENSAGTEDIVVVLDNKEIPISLKSIKSSSSGTLRNLGAKGLNHEKITQKVLALDEKIQKEVMEKKDLEEITKYQVKGFVKKDSKLKESLENSVNEDIGELNHEFYDYLATMSQEDVRVFIEKNIFDISEDRDLWVCLANKDGCSIWNAKDKYAFKPSDEITLVNDDSTNKSFKILKNKESLLRIQTSFTNRVGSSVCFRVFLDN